MISLDKFKVKVIKDEVSYSQVEIGPLPKGYGYTVGNSLRRLLLSAIPGASVVGIKIEGVKHEYTALAGVRDDILQLILKLKDIAVVSHSDELQVLKLNVKGEKGKARVVKASDIELTGEVEIKNPDYEITTLADEKSKLVAEIYVKSGIGYVMPDETMRKEIGMIPTDGVFSPVKRVQMKIQPARVGQETELDKIVFDIYTNSTANGVESLLKAAEIYDEVANRLVDLLGGDSLAAEEEIRKEMETVTEEKQKVLVSDLGASTRLTNSLLNAGITDLNMIDGKTIDEIMNFKGMGKKSLDELFDLMKEYNLNIKN